MSFNSFKYILANEGDNFASAKIVILSPNSSFCQTCSAQPKLADALKLKPGDARLMKSTNPKEYKYTIYVCFADLEQSKYYEEIVAKCFKNAFDLLKENDCASVIIPLFYDDADDEMFEYASKVMQNSVQAALKSSNNCNIEVYFECQNQRSLDVYKNTNI